MKIGYIVLMSLLALNSIYDIIKHMVNKFLKEIVSHYCLIWYK